MDQKLLDQGLLVISFIVCCMFVFLVVSVLMKPRTMLQKVRDVNRLLRSIRADEERIVTEKLETGRFFEDIQFRIFKQTDDVVKCERSSIQTLGDPWQTTTSVVSTTV